MMPNLKQASSPSEDDCFEVHESSSSCAILLAGLRRGNLESPNQTEEAMDAAVTLSQACAELHDNLSALAASRSVLDDTTQSLTVEAVASALDAMRFARRTCDGLMTTIKELAPATSDESLLRSETLSAYLALPNGNELLLSIFIADASQRLFQKTRPQEALPKPTHNAQSIRPDGDRCPPEQPASSSL